MSTDKMREALVMARAGLVWYQENYPQTFSECDNEALEQIDAALSQSEPAQVSQPVAVMWQNEETGNTGFVDLFQVENGFFKNNPRLKQVCFCYSSSPDYEALHELFQTAVVDFHAMKAENEALKSELQHWKSNHADVVKRLAIATQRPDLPVDRIPAIKENKALKLRVAELESATEHLGLTPQQAKDGLARYKASVAERDRLQSECDILKEALKAVLRQSK